MSTIRIRYRSPPSAWRYMAQGLRSRPGWDSGRGLPDLHLAWNGFRIEPDRVGEIRRLAGIDVDDGRLAVLVPHVTGFRLLMAALTHPAWPLPIRHALQVRNRLRLHRPLHGDERFDLTVGVGGWRVADKGTEVDLCARLLQGDDCAWDSVITFFWVAGEPRPALVGSWFGLAAGRPA